MESILELLDCDNIARVWIERFDATGSGPNAGREFELHVVRRTADGSMYDDSVEHLSESEREVTGLVVALAGYLVHDVHEILPVMLIDSVEAIDVGRLAALIEYFNEYPDYLVAALLEEDAAAIDEAHDALVEF